MYSILCILLATYMWLRLPDLEPKGDTLRPLSSILQQLVQGEGSWILLNRVMVSAQATSSLEGVLCLVTGGSGNSTVGTVRTLLCMLMLLPNPDPLTH